MTAKIILRVASVVLVLGGVVILGATFYPLAEMEIKYKPAAIKAEEMIPVDTELGILIPKIGANSKIVSQVDPFDSREYQLALTKGVAHAKGTPLPGDPGVSFLFSHSSVDFFRATQYNSVFYLLSKLEPNDPITVYREGAKLDFVVENKQILSASRVDLLNQKVSEAKLLLMTCWPPGTSLQRLVVTAKIK